MDRADEIAALYLTDSRKRSYLAEEIRGCINEDRERIIGLVKEAIAGVPNWLIDKIRTGRAARAALEE